MRPDSQSEKVGTPTPHVWEVLPQADELQLSRGLRHERGKSRAGDQQEGASPVVKPKGETLVDLQSELNSFSQIVHRGQNYKTVHTRSCKEFLFQSDWSLLDVATSPPCWRDLVKKVLPLLHIRCI